MLKSALKRLPARKKSGIIAGGRFSVNTSVKKPTKAKLYIKAVCILCG